VDGILRAHCEHGRVLGGEIGMRDDIGRITMGPKKRESRSRAFRDSRTS
jgi:hypothetical protein